MHRLKFIKPWISIGLAIIVASCNGAFPVPDSTGVSGQDLTATKVSATDEPTARPVPTASQTSPTAASETPDSPSPSPSPTSVTAANCFTIVNATPNTTIANGRIILESTEVEGNHYGFDKYMWDLGAGTKEQIVPVNENYYNVVESPNKARIAYGRAVLDAGTGTYVPIEIVIADVNGQALQSISWQDGWIAFDWLSDESLIINAAGQDPEQSTAQRPATLVAVDVSTGTQDELPADFPSIYEDYPTVMWGAWGATAYDPSLDRVVYASQHLDQSDAAYTLWDIQLHRPITSVATSLFVAPPRWSPDASSFVVAAPSKPETILTATTYSEDLYIVARNGAESRRITDLAAEHPNSSIRDYAWSPDGQYIAFWLSDLPEGALLFERGHEHLMIVEVATGETADTCIPGWNELLAPPLPIERPIWSPNSQQLIMVSGASDGTRQLVLVDIANRAVIRLDDNMQPIAWLIAGS